MKIRNFIIGTILFTMSFLNTQLFASKKVIRKVEITEDSITIKGVINPTLLAKFATQNLLIEDVDNSDSNASDCRIMKEPISKSGSFIFKYKASKPFTYLSFNYIDKESQQKINLSNYLGENKIFKFFKESYLFEKGDKVNVEFYKKGNFRFSGRGSEKLNCQSEMHNIDVDPMGSQMRVATLKMSQNYDAGLSLRSDMNELEIKMRLRILKTYEQTLSPMVYKILYQDQIAIVETKMLRELWMYALRPDKKDVTNAILFLKGYLAKSTINSIDSNAIVHSVYYIGLLFNREFNDLKFNNNTSGNYMAGDSFKLIYDRLTNKYQGLMRDKILYIGFSSLNRFFSDEQKPFVNKAINLINDDYFNNLFQEWAEKQYSAYPFELTDAFGKKHFLKEYKGKVLIIDTWSTGCVYCVSLNAAMKQIRDKYKGNKNVIFMTVCTDVKKSMWLKSVSSLKYTSPETVNLYTNGLGMRDPFILNYAFVGNPNQLIINRKGELISGHPPRVDTRAGSSVAMANTLTFIKLIEQALQN